jgi:hypothetical protein
MPVVRIRGLAIAGGIAAVALLAPPAAGAQDVLPDGESVGDPTESEQAQKPARVSVRLRGLKGGRLPVRNRVRAVGRVRPFVPGQRVRTRVVRMGRVVKGKRVRVKRVPGTNAGRFELRSPRLYRPGKYRVRAVKPPTRRQAGASDRTRIFTIRYPRLRSGDRSKAVALFNELLRKRGYYAPNGRAFSSGTQRAVLAFRKVNRMARTTRATVGMFKRLAAGKGGFNLRYPDAGRHVEVDISHQVMVLAAKGKPKHTFHVSTGKPGTPSDRGHFRFFRRQPGYNNVGMYYSVYYNGGEAIHGYKSVPTYPASGGCIRNPTPNSRFIYDWVSLGMSIYVY